jgi:hypothetical protein
LSCFCRMTLMHSPTPMPHDQVDATSLKLSPTIGGIVKQLCVGKSITFCHLFKMFQMA